MATVSDGGWTKWALGMTSTMLVTGGLAWFSFGGGVSRAEGETLRRTDSELQQQQAVVSEKLARQQKDLDELKASVKESNTETQRKLDNILERLPRDER